MNEFITKLRNGELNETEVKEFEGKLSEEGKKLLKEALAFTTKRQDEEGKVREKEAKVFELDTLIKQEEEKLSKTKDQGAQFRQEQVDKARDKFFKEYNVPAEKQAEYLEKFKALDTGKVDSDLIYQDFVGVHAFLNKDTLLKAQQDQIESQRIADEELARQANGGQGGGGHQDAPPKYSKEATELAKKAGITEESANRQITEGMERKLE